MDAENILYYAVAILAIALGLNEVIATVTGHRLLQFGRTIYALVMGALFAFFGRAIGTVLGNQQLGIIIGAVIGAILGYSLLINALVKWLWKQFCEATGWVVKIIIILAIVFLIISVFKINV